MRRQRAAFLAAPKSNTKRPPMQKPIAAIDFKASNT